MDIAANPIEAVYTPGAPRKVYPAVKPLPLLFAPLIAALLGLFQGAEQKRIFVRRCELTRERIADKKELKRAIKALSKESLHFGALIQLAYTQLGQRSDRRWDGANTTEKGKRARIAKVQFHEIFMDSEILYYKILTRKRYLFGTRAMLPYGVRVENLIDETAHAQLEATLERDVNISADSNGVWVRVFRLQGVDGIPKLVTFREILDKYSDPADMLQGKIVLGVGDRKIAHHFYLEDNPHVLVGGATKTGKSNLINNVISALIRFLTPDQLQLTLIDLKLVEFDFYEGIPHLNGPIVFELKDVKDTLIKIRRELFRRAALFKAHRCKNLYVWNQQHPTEQLPRHVVIIDEFAELVNGDDKDLCEEIFKQARSISSLGRALGIHMIICTQRPSAQVVPMDIKNNAAVRIGGATGDMHASRIIMDSGDLANLEDIKGRMVYKIGQYRHKIQTPLITDEDVEECVAIAKGRAARVIDLAGTEAVINRDGLTRWIIANNGGLLGYTALYSKLKPLAINRDMLQAYLKDLGSLIMLGDGTEIPIISVGKSRKLAPIELQLTPESETFLSDIQAQLEIPSTPPAFSGPNLGDSTIELAAPDSENFDPFDQFIHDATIKSNGSIVPALELYEHYKAWCEMTGYIATSNHRFGREMGQRLAKARNEQGRIYQNIKLQLNQQSVASVASGTHLSQENQQ
jgi:hypothetical protein